MSRGRIPASAKRSENRSLLHVNEDLREFFAPQEASAVVLQEAREVPSLTLYKVAVMIDDVEQRTEQDIVYGKIYCANCAHCKVVRVSAGDGSQYLLRVRCAAGKWKTQSGEEKLYKYFTLTRRSLFSCDSYCSMGDTRGYLRQLRSLLPQKDETYSQVEETPTTI